MELFGVIVRAGSKNGLRLARDEYARINKKNSSALTREDILDLWDPLAHIYEDEDHRRYMDERCEKWRGMALENFDLNMAFFAQLDEADFEQVVEKAVDSQRGMREITDLKKWGR